MTICLYCNGCGYELRDGHALSCEDYVAPGPATAASPAIEKPTTEYREHLGDVAPGALEIIDAQTRCIRNLESRCAAAEKETQHVMAHRSRMQKRIVDLEAQVLASDTVSKVEYAAMVQQRDTMRAERQAARAEATEARSNLQDLLADEDAWKGGYELEGWAGDRLFRLAGLEPRCPGPIDEEPLI